jgi:hypothetical protein
MLDFFALALGLALPWTFGIALLASLYRFAHGNRADPPSASWLVGCGWFVGIFLLTLTMRGLSAAGIRFGIVSVGTPLVAMTTFALIVALRRSPLRLVNIAHECLRALGGQGLEGWQRTLWRLLVAWLAVRFALLLAEVWWRPLYPWDAWTQWGTKARVWFELGRLVPFVEVTEWLSGNAPDSYFDHGPHYPATVPLLQVWAAIVIGRWDDALVNLPWWITGVAFAVALHGGLKQLGFPYLFALGGTAMVLSLPIVNVHVALAGYADLPMAAYITLATLAALRFVRTRSLADAVLALLLLAACVMVKNPGKAWVIVLLPGFVVAALPRRGLALAGLAFGVAGLGILVLARTGVMILGYQLLPQFMMPWNALFDAYFSFGNWNLLWYFALATAVLGWRHLLSREVAPFTCIVAGGLMFLFVGFAFTNAFLWVEDQSTVNRATLHLAPLIVVWMLVTLRAWYFAHSEREPALEARPG